MGKSIQEQWEDIEKFLLANPKTHLIWEYSCPECEETVRYDIHEVSLKCKKCGWKEINNDNH